MIRIAIEYDETTDKLTLHSSNPEKPWQTLRALKSAEALVEMAALKQERERGGGIVVPALKLNGPTPRS